MSTFSLFCLTAIFAAQLHAQSTADTQPSIIVRNDPEYSAEAARARVQSTVVLSITVGVDGKAHDIHVAQGGGFGLDEKAIEAMGTWVFKAGTKDGRKVALPANVEMNFSMLAKDPEDHSGQLARLNFTLPAQATRPELIVGKLPGNPLAPGDQSLRFHLQVNAQGVPENVTVLSSSDKAWEKQSLRVLQSWRFRPASVNGTPVPAEGVFELQHSGRLEPAETMVVQDATADESSREKSLHVVAPLPITGLVARAHHTATRLANGTVLLAGGAAPGPANREIASAQIFDWATRRIANTGDLLTARQFHTATLLRDGTVLIAGGQAGGRSLASAEIFDPSTGKFSATGNLHEARHDHAAALLPDGRVLLCGGVGAADNLASAEIYDPKLEIFIPAGKMTTARVSFQSVILNDGRILLVGGDSGNTSEVFNPESGTFVPTGKPAMPGTGPSVRLDSGQVLVVGRGNAQMFDPATDTFHTVGEIPVSPNQNVAVLTASGKVLLTGGAARSEVFDPLSESFAPGPQLTGIHVGHTATLLEDGTVFVAGSSVPDSGSSAELITIK